MKLSTLRNALTFIHRNNGEDVEFALPNGEDFELIPRHNGNRTIVTIAPSPDNLNMDRYTTEHEAQKKWANVDIVEGAYEAMGTFAPAEWIEKLTGDTTQDVEGK